MPPIHAPTATRDLLARLREANLAFNRRYPGESNRRQPVHTVYGAADQFTSDIAGRHGDLALQALAEYAPTPEELARAAALPEALASRIYERVTEKLRREPVEDFRADFEDGYGNRPDAEEDGHAEAVAREMASGLAAGTLPPFTGIRVKPFNEERRERSLRTIDLFLTTLVRAAGGRLPENFVITLPKVTIPEQSAALADLFDLLEPALGLPAGSLRFEIMIETPQAVLDADGRSPLPHLAAAARGRCVAAHFGTYDYTAACNITAEHQSMLHPVCNFARHMMQVAFAGTGLWLSDGSTNVLPVPPHSGVELTPTQREENRAAVHRAWRLHAAHIRHSLAGGVYQGWDLHPAQLVTRYAALYAFFLRGFDAAADRLRKFTQRAAQATSMAGEVVDDAATGQALLNHVLRAVRCGAVGEEEALAKTGLTREELLGRRGSPLPL
jgi:citrate lyase beta subunit